jgi:hypothetical protein
VWECAGINSFSGRNGKEGNLLALHPTVKPVPLLSDAITDCSNIGDIVLDPFLGSGSTLIAAEKPIGRVSLSKLTRCMSMSQSVACQAPASRTNLSGWRFNMMGELEMRN